MKIAKVRLKINKLERELINRPQNLSIELRHAYMARRGEQLHALRQLLLEKELHNEDA